RREREQPGLTTRIPLPIRERVGTVPASTAYCRWGFPGRRRRNRNRRTDVLGFAALSTARRVLGEGMEITIRAAQLNAQEIQLDDQITLQEVRLSGTDIRLAAGPRGPVRIAELNGTLIVTEASLNRVLKQKPPEGTRDLELATLTGR